jgi:desulfoferrodoxin-like iron-binding protein
MSDLGKRYVCAVCGAEILCTKAGAGQPVCCEEEMQLQQPKKLPSSD